MPNLDHWAPPRRSDDLRAACVSYLRAVEAADAAISEGDRLQIVLAAEHVRSVATLVHRAAERVVPCS